MSGPISARISQEETEAIKETLQDKPMMIGEKPLYGSVQAFLFAPDADMDIFFRQRHPRSKEIRQIATRCPE